MAKKIRDGRRITRNQRECRRVPDMGYYVIVTDTEGTERCYFEGLRDSLPSDLKERLVIKVLESSTKNLIEKCIEQLAYDPQYRIGWIILDRDKVPNFDDIIAKAESSGLNVGWSNICFEIWLFAYFGAMPAIDYSKQCCSRFSELFYHRVKQNYSKTDKDLYKKLCQYGDEEQALKRAVQRRDLHHKSGNFKPSKMYPCTTVDVLVREIRKKVKAVN